MKTDVDYPFESIEWFDYEGEDDGDFSKFIMEEYFLTDVTPALQFAEVVDIEPYSDIDMVKNGIVVTKAGRLGEIATKLPVGILMAWTEFFFKGYYDDESEVDLERIFYIDNSNNNVIVALPKSETLKIPKEKLLERAFTFRTYESIKDIDVSLYDTVNKYNAFFYNDDDLVLRDDFKKEALGRL